MSAEASNWLLRRSAENGAARRLFCFHHAGGSAADFARWQSVVGAEYEVLCVQLPGRGMRMREPLISDARAIADHVVTAMLPLLDRDYVMVGHSVGGLIAYEVVKLLQQAAQRLPLRLVTCARAAPRLTTGERTHAYPREQFVESLLQYGALPEAVLQDRDLMDFFLPMLRADVKIYETYEYQPATPLACPIVALVGTHDTVVTLDRARGWREESAISCTLGTVPGGHFFPKTNAEGTVAQALAGL